MCDKNENILSKECLKYTDFAKATDKLDQRITYAQNSAEDIDRKITSTDNYLEKYLPIKIHKFIISSLRNVFENKKDLKKLRDYEAKKDWLLNEAVQNDNGIPGDFKKTVPDDANYRNDKTRAPRKSRRVTAGKERKMDDTPSSIAGSSFNVSPTKKTTKKSKKRKGSKSNMSQKSSQMSVIRAGEDYDKDNKNNLNLISVSYNETLNYDEDEAKSQTRSRAPQSIEARESQSKRTSTLVARDTKAIPEERESNQPLENGPTLKHDKSVHLELDAREGVTEGSKSNIKIATDYGTIKVTPDEQQQMEVDSLSAEDIPGEQSSLPDEGPSKIQLNSPEQVQENNETSEDEETR